MKNQELFYELLNTFQKNNIVPLIGIIPNNKDEKIIEKTSSFKLEDLKKLIKQKKVEVALHGYEHKYQTKEKGILKLTSKSEFSGLSYLDQETKLKKGLKIIKERLGVRPKYFFAPSHNYDKNTLKLLKKYDLINVDGISLNSFVEQGVLHIPQQTNSVFDSHWPFKKGIFVYHFHPSALTKKIIDRTKFVLKTDCYSFKEQNFAPKRNSLKSYAFRIIFKLKNLASYLLK